MIGGCEETTTGVIRLNAMEKDGVLPYPVIAVNNALTKHMFDNRYGTGQSTLDGIIRATNVLLAGRNVVVVGYGWCGRGVASRAAGMGAHVIVTEIDPRKAIEAAMDGYQVMPMADAAKIGDIFVTVTGNYHVIAESHFKLDEGRRDRLQLGPLQRRARSRRHQATGEGRDRAARVRRAVRVSRRPQGLYPRRRPPGQPRRGRGPPGGGDGYVVRQPGDGGGASRAKHHASMKKEVYDVPVEIDEEVASLKLSSMGIEIDTLTPEQVKYMASWSEGT